MTQIEKLEKVIKEWEQKGEDISKESSIARKHNVLRINDRTDKNR